MKRPRLTASVNDHPAIVAYRRTGRYPIQGRDKHFSWDTWTLPERQRTPEAEAARAVAFISSLTHSKGAAARTPFRLRPWQESITRQLFGTLDAEGYRQYRTALIFLPTRNGKSELAAAYALYGLLGDQEPGAELYSVAVDVDQAALVFNTAANMVRHDPALASRLEIVPSRRRILHHASASAYRVLASDAPSALGVNASGLVMDELAAWPHRDLYDVMASRTGSRRAPLTIIITTAGSDEHGVGKEVYDYACRVRDGAIDDPSFLPVLYEAPEDADPWSEETWHASNPALGDFRSLEEFRIAARHAKEVPGREGSFRRLYLNQWVSQQDQPWLPLAAWDACAVERLESPAGRRAFLGLDLSATTDLTALVTLVADGHGGYDVTADFWCPADLIRERTRRDRVPYDTWVQQGYLHATPGNIISKDVIRARIHALMDELDVAAVAVDPWNARDLTAQLQADGVPAVEVQQTMGNLTSATKEVEVLVLSGRLRHDGHPILRWNIGNACVDSDANGNVRPSKRRSVERIDGATALVTALARAMVAPPPAQGPRVTLVGWPA
jgi:phage terminase large subunit-like protein